MEGDLGKLLQGIFAPILVEIDDRVFLLFIFLKRQAEDCLREGGVIDIKEVSLASGLGEVLYNLDRNGKQHHIAIHQGSALKCTAGGSGHYIDASIDVGTDREINLVIFVGIIVGGGKAACRSVDSECVNTSDRVVAKEFSSVRA